MAEIKGLSDWFISSKGDYQIPIDWKDLRNEIEFWRLVGGWFGVEFGVILAGLFKKPVFDWPVTFDLRFERDNPVIRQSYD